MVLQILKLVAKRLRTKHKSGVNVEIVHPSFIGTPDTVPANGLIYVVPMDFELPTPRLLSDRDLEQAQYADLTFHCEHMIIEQKQEMASERLFAFMEQTQEALSFWQPDTTASHIAMLSQSYLPPVEGEFRGRITFMTRTSKVLGLDNF